MNCQVCEVEAVKTNSGSVLIHDINSSLSALQGAVEVLRDEWRKNPELVDKIIPLTVEKLNLLKEQLDSFRNI